MSQVTHLASGALNRSGDTNQHRVASAARQSQLRHGGLADETLHHRPTPKALAALAAAMMRCLGEAQTELAAKIRNSR
jgi:hypothetical protein